MILFVINMLLYIKLGPKPSGTEQHLDAAPAPQPDVQYVKSKPFFSCGGKESDAVPVPVTASTSFLWYLFRHRLNDAAS
jgi:hypothetical protein